MKKQILNLGIALKKAEQAQINGGKEQCDSHYQCGSGYCCNTAGWCQLFGDQGNTGYLCDGSII
ncbi:MULTISPECIES: hypothetical protein [Tenacibaculum]|uniref:Bacteriocin n=1 Tax=Tenacibaculum discolor TaxID=361581 RepID=A0A2G1BY43_9FLAO|nr:hypothetical protein [Tenacibaculum discolor]MDP2541224.1 hypothetical protein [Tenacibaculum discolor]PHN98927.1 hypothetical protein CSC81_01715 [Tenacibaculum discolor]RLJ97812.1 hypothetical protein C8N27_2903 [Tenacibaculum discolor]